MPINLIVATFTHPNSSANASDRVSAKKMMIALVLDMSPGAQLLTAKMSCSLLSPERVYGRSYINGDGRDLLLLLWFLVISNRFSTNRNRL